MVNRFTFPSYVSLCNTVFVVGINLYYGWASEVAMKACIIPIILYNIFDLCVGWDGYVKKDWLTILHHIGTMCGMIYFRYIIQISYTMDLYILTWWMLLGEVSSIFNNIRVIFHKTRYKSYTDLLFAFIFIPLRTIMTLGSIYSLQNFENVVVPIIIVTIFAFLNVYWGTMIVKKLMTKRK